MKYSMTRRSALARVAAAATTIAAAAKLPPVLAAETAAVAPAKLKGNIHHSACRGPYRKIPLDDEKGLENCAIGLKRVMPAAEKHKVTLCMELLNSKRNHKDYQCDHTAWGVELCKRVSSERFKLLYDIFHMQIMEGDVCDTIKENHAFIGHYHTGGVPGRGEIDDTQELNYRRIMQEIVATGFKGYVGQEFSPKRPDALASLRQAIQICDV